MAKRFKVSRSKDKRAFKRSASKGKAVNLSLNIPRGGRCF